MVKVIYLAATLILAGLLVFIGKSIQPPVWTLLTAREEVEVLRPTLDTRVAKGMTHRAVIIVTQDGGPPQTVRGYGWTIAETANAAVERWPVGSTQPVRRWNGELWRGYLLGIEKVLLAVGAAALLLLVLMVRGVLRRS